MWAGSELPPAPRDVRRVIATVLQSPDRFVRLIRLGPRGLVSMARFLLRIVPRASRALAALRARAACIPDAELRAQALAAIDGKAFHVQGGCILATFLHGTNATRYVRIIASLETIYDYLDNLCDRLPNVTERAFATLHEALLDALDDRRVPGPGSGSSYYRHGPCGDDGGYLRSLVLDVRREVSTLPHYPAVREALAEIASYYARLQTLKHGAAGVREEVCGRWYAEHRDRFPDLYWWEFAAACGSSLPVFALLYLASQRQLDARAIAPTVAAYFPNVSAVHILLDYFIDQAEDREHRELNFVACYASPAEAIERVRRLVGRTRERLALLAHAGRHEFVLRAMCLFYLTHPKVFEQRLDRESAALLSAL
jgi:tetraprenyl-beta-curcumene synthase